MRVPPGPIVQYYSDLASGVIAPEDMRIEDLQYRIQINPDGTVFSQSDSISLISRYQLAIRRVVGFVMDPDFAGNAPSLVNVQIRESGRNFEIFKRPISMQSLLSKSGAANGAEWDGVYITVPGTDLAVEWSIDTARWAALVGTTKEFGIQILGDYTACTPR
jgi:hypothetical protein